jgi:hypothetical protein
VVTSRAPRSIPEAHTRLALLTERVKRGECDSEHVVIKTVTDAELRCHLAAADQHLRGEDITVAVPIAHLPGGDGQHRLVYPDYGAGTAEALVPSEVIRLSRRVCGLLGQHQVIWLDCAPKNMVLPDGTPGRVVLVDFDHGLIPVSSTSDASILVRCIQMAEEYAPLRVNLFPFWPQGWPPPDRLRTQHGAAVQAVIPVAAAGSRRVAVAVDMLALGDEIADHELLRLYRVFADLVAGTRDLSTHSAWDHVGRSEAGTRIRVTASMLAHWARHHGASDVVPELTHEARKCATHIAADNDPMARSTQLVIHHLEPHVHARARSLLGNQWAAALRAHARASVLTPAAKDAARPLVLP